MMYKTRLKYNTKILPKIPQYFTGKTCSPLLHYHCVNHANSCGNAIANSPGLLHAETGFSYFGARYYDSDLMTGWLSVDPMADKYPSLSPYAYCAWNPVKLVDPDGEDWYETKAGKIQYTTKIISKSDFEKSNIKGRYLGKTYTSKNKYYSLFGQVVDKNTTNGEITAKLDEAMIAFAEYREAMINYTYSYKNPDEPIQETTDFSNICKFIDRFGTTSDNIHHPSKMGTYAGIADIYFYATGNNMDGKFIDWSISNRITGNNGYFATSPGKYLTITKHSVGGVMVGLNFKKQENVTNFMNQFYRLFPKAKLNQ